MALLHCVKANFIFSKTKYYYSKKTMKDIYSRIKFNHFHMLKKAFEGTMLDELKNVAKKPMKY